MRHPSVRRWYTNEMIPLITAVWNPKHLSRCNVRIGTKAEAGDLPELEKKTQGGGEKPIWLKVMKQMTHIQQTT